MKFYGNVIPIGKIQLQDLINEVMNNTHIGAITTFTGIVRESSDSSDKTVVGLEVEVWEEKGEEAMTQIAREIGEKYNLLGVRIIHLYGNLKLGDPIVYVVLASIHRKEAFMALEEIIDAYKQRSPVWKKEIYSDGSGKWISTSKH